MGKKNAGPEKQLEKEVLVWCRTRGWKVHVVEAKAVYSVAAGRYLNSQIPPGFPDVVGMNESGVFVGIELKAHGRRSTLRDNQRLFLIECISHGAFAVCVDRLDQLVEFYKAWSISPSKEYLISILPVKKEELDFRSSLF